MSARTWRFKSSLAHQYRSIGFGTEEKMALIYITGIETAGKSTVCKELLRRGYEACDIDEGIAHYYDKVTGEQSEWNGSSERRTREWHKTRHYMMDRKHVKQLAKQAQNKPIFLCGTTQNDKVVLDLFGELVYLYLDEATLRQRMKNRLSTEFAFAPHEQEAVLSWHKSSEDTYRQHGATMIDATQPVERIVDKIIKKVQ